MAAYAAGETRCFAALFERWAPRLQRFLMRALGDPQAADDLLQITFLKVHRARAEFRSECSLRAWLFTIAAHALRDELRRRKRAPIARAEQQEAMAETMAADHGCSLESSERAEALRVALQQLPASQRVVLHLHRFEEISFAQIARVLGTTECAVKLRAFRAREALRERLGETLKASSQRTPTCARNPPGNHRTLCTLED